MNKLKCQIPSVSIQTAIKVLSDNAITEAREAYKVTDDDGSKVGRLTKDVEAFYRTLSDQLGISLQEAITITLKGAIESNIVSET